MRRIVLSARARLPSARGVAGAGVLIRPPALLLACCLAAAGCSSDRPTSPGANAAPLSQRLESTHYVYRYAAGDHVDTAWQEAYYTWAVARLGIAPDRKLEYDKYLSREHLQALTGRSTNGFAELDAPRFHTIWPVDNHEGVHALVITWIGHPPALFNEGIAVAHQTDPARAALTPAWNGRPLDDWAREFERDGRLPPLDSLLESPGFFRYSEGVTYPAAGSFVRFLIDSGGMPAMAELIRRAAFYDSRSRTRAAFAAVYGESVDVWWERWRDHLR